MANPKAKHYKQRSTSLAAAATEKKKKKKKTAKAVSKPALSSAFPPQLLNDGMTESMKPTKAGDGPAIEALYPGAVYVARNALSLAECEAWIAYSESGSGFEAVSHPATWEIAHRECGRVQRDDWEMSHRLYRRIQDIMNRVADEIDVSRDPRYRPATCNGNLRLYKYTKGQWFGKHYDGAKDVSEHFDGGHTEMTVLFYLSSCTGGATKFHPPHGNGNGRGKRGNIVQSAFVPEAGAVLIHAHGDRCLAHEAEPVLDGVKYVLRTDIVYSAV